MNYAFILMMSLLFNQGLHNVQKKTLFASNYCQKIRQDIQIIN